MRINNEQLVRFNLLTIISPLLHKFFFALQSSVRFSSTRTAHRERRAEMKKQSLFIYFIFGFLNKSICFHIFFLWANRYNLVNQSNALLTFAALRMECKLFLSIFFFLHSSTVTACFIEPANASVVHLKRFIIHIVMLVTRR